jgi:hypothetical protein
MNIFDFIIRIISVDEKTRSYVVAFYTQTLLDHFEQVELPARIDSIIAGNSLLSRAEAEAQARATWFPGEVRSITIYDPGPPPIGQELVEYLSRYVPYPILKHAERCLREQSLMDKDIVGVEADASIDIGDPVTQSTDVTATMRISKG